ncbi:MAG: UvrB/UvrC motif-containing protein [bacterium]
MYWINFLHIYQPISQTKEILDAVVSQSYRPLFAGFLKVSNPDFKLNLNINGALTEILWEKGYKDVIENIKELAEKGKLEFTESAKYHCFLPYLPAEEIERQIILNHKTNKKIFGKAYQPECFFPPEMAFSEKVAKVVSKLGYKFILIDEIGYNGKNDNAPYDSLFSVSGTKLTAVFRERKTSNLIMGAVVRSQKDFLHTLEQDLKINKYMFTAMDGETFGHHRPGLEKSLFDIVEGQTPKQIFASELTQYFATTKEIKPRESTWASCENDIEKNVQFYSWNDPKNRVHQYQWRLFNFVLKVVADHRLKDKTRKKLDAALASDQFFWASGEPWWSIEMIEKGAWGLREVIKSIPDISDADWKKTDDLYQQVIAAAFWWQRSGDIEEKSKKYKEAVKIPFKGRTLEMGGSEVYQTIVSLMEKKMQEAASEKNYEKAILWRDAIWKLETKNDIYDMVHVVDSLRFEFSEEFKKLDPKLNELFQQYKEKYKKLKPGQPESRRI